MHVASASPSRRSIGSATERDTIDGQAHTPRLAPPTHHAFVRSVCLVCRTIIGEEGDANDRRRATPRTPAPTGARQRRERGGTARPRADVPPGPWRLLPHHVRAGVADAVPHPGGLRHARHEQRRDAGRGGAGHPDDDGWTPRRARGHARAQGSPVGVQLTARHLRSDHRGSGLARLDRGSGRSAGAGPGEGHARSGPVAGAGAVAAGARAEGRDGRDRIARGPRAAALVLRRVDDAGGRACPWSSPRRCMPRCSTWCHARRQARTTCGRAA